MKSAARVVLGFAAVAGAAVHKKDGVHIEPELDPKSHKKFFDKDYPSDVSHRTELDVDHPYPVVQASSDYDKDYTKDENNNKMDAAMWDAQLKHAKKLSDAAAEVERLKAKLAKAEDAEKAAEDTEDEEKKELSEAEKKAAEAGKAAGGEGGAKAPMTAEEEQKAVDGAADTVNKEVNDLDDCKKQLEEAKARLAKLQEEANEAEAVQKKEEALKLAAEDAEKAAEKVEKDAEATAETETQELDVAKKHHKQEKEELDAMQGDLDRAEERLRSFRGGGGAKSEPPAPEPEAHSGAQKSAVAVVSSLAVLLSCAMASSQ